MNDSGSPMTKPGVAKDDAPPTLFQFEGGPPLPGRCVFANRCLCIRLLGLPEKTEVSGCFAGCSGMLLVSHGSLEMRTKDTCASFGEGESIKLPLREPTELWPGDATDVVLFSRLE